MLEHDCVTWSPHLKQDIDKIERVQRRYTKRLRGLEGLPYSDRLCRLQLSTLELRRLYFDLYMCYRIIFGHVNVRIYLLIMKIVHEVHTCQISLSLAVQLRLEAIPTNCISDIVVIVLDLHTLLSVLSTCGIVFQQIV